MALVRRARCGQNLFAAPVKSGSQRREHSLGFVVADAAFAFEVQADLDAAGMETFAPVEFRVRLEIVPLETHARAAHAAVQMPPAVADASPQGAFGERGRGGGFARCAVFNYSFCRFGHGDNVPSSARRANHLVSQSIANK